MQTLVATGGLFFEPVSSALQPVRPLTLDVSKRTKEGFVSGVGQSLVPAGVLFRLPHKCHFVSCATYFYQRMSLKHEQAVRFGRWVPHLQDAAPGVL